METNIISVKYEDDYMPKTFSGKSYSYYVAIPVKVGDLVIAPTANGDKIARVSQINVPEYKVEFFKAALKLITNKIDREKYLQSNKILKEVA